MSAKSPCTIVPITLADVPTLAARLRASKIALVIDRLLWKDWPNDKCQRPQYTCVIEGRFKDASSANPPTFVYKAVDEKGEIVEQIVISYRKPIVKNEEDWRREKREKITHISIPPVYRHRSIGSWLTKKAFEAEETKLPIYFSSEPAAQDFLLAQGFKDDKFVDTDLSKYAGPYEGFGIFRFYGVKHERRKEVNW